MIQAKKGSKNTRLKGMDEFLQAELEIGQTETAGHGEKPIEELHQKCSRGAVVKHTQSQFTKAGSSQKKLRWKPVVEAPSKETFTSRVDPEPTHGGSEEDENSEIPLLREAVRPKVL